MTLNNRWVQLSASLVAMVMIANLQYSWTLFVEPIRAGTGWPLSSVQQAFWLFILFQTWVQPLDGWFIDRLGPRGFIAAGGILCGAGWGSMGYATTLPVFWALYVAAGVGAAFVYSGSMGCALKWFRDRRGLAAGIIAAGFGAGTALFNSSISGLIQTHGYRTAFLWTGVLQGAVIFIAAQALRPPPREAVTPVKPAAKAERIGRRQYTTPEMLRTPQFYVMYLAFVMMAIGGLVVTAQTGPMARAWLISPAALVMATTLSPIANGVSRIFWGWASDRLGRENTMAVAFVLQSACLMAVLQFGRVSDFAFVLTLVLTYFTWGEVFSLFPSLSGDYFGTRHATANYAVLYTAKGIAAAIGVSISSWLVEQFGSWSGAFYGSAVLALLAAGLAIGLRVAKTPRVTVVEPGNL